MTITAPVIRYHGGKFRLAPWIIEHFPPHQAYIEPFGGAAGVLMQKPRSHGEVYNDLDGDIVNLFRVLQSAAQREALVELLVLTPYARDEFERAWIFTDEPVEQARRTVIRAQMGFGSAGASKGTTGFRIDCYRQYGTAQQLWARYPDQLSAIGKRLAGVLIENRPAIDIMLAHDTAQALHYVDPPYMHDTRVRGAQKGRYYRHELDDDQHAELLSILNQLTGMVVLSGYPSELYQAHLEGWTMNSTSARISAGRGSDTRTECLWINPACMAALSRRGLPLEVTA
ncbi:TPA: DNA adenine methylase [Pseudomonas aeruginosa]|uniref:DNA adenine methylase n=1 Tax=Pseudomonas aeruginosa TaxID=287 RepID=UPI00053F184A|nr:DNA adenine methylase [Pseudomonas aeruginosa]RCM51634.1 DNA adenine methylase [Pseudomonas aeruginosa]RCM57828.1 DNA adenine methylase [Pseudomonas aeruginosa]RCM60621.1 DNA adenine methylase [Pseudomonas aeruginosa]RCM70554.1 DNA adenine methylase [Pseudomonas aeruginosa]RCN17155.1 DNA adenine methylase [Pseudomonas aeruginosa]